MAFVSADITTDSTQLVNDALDLLNALLETAGMPGWNSQDADLLVILLNALAPIAADLATTESTVLNAIFRNFGTQLFNLPYNNGANASVLSTWTFTSPAPLGGYTIDAGTSVIIDSFAFYVANEVDVAVGLSSATVLLVASETGLQFNGLGGIGDGFPDVQLNDAIDWVAGITTASVTSGGADQEDDDAYQDRLQAVLALQAPRPIVAADFATFVASDIALDATGVAVGRSTAIDGYYPVARTLSTGGSGPAPLTLSGSLTSGSPTVTVVTAPYYGAVAATAASVTGTGIPSSTTVASSPAPTTSSFTLSGNATANETAETITVSAWTNVKGAVTVFVTDDSGNALTAASMDALQTWLSNYWLQNALVFVEPPSYNTVYIAAEVHVLPAYVGSETSVNATVQTAVVSYLSPLTWGNVSTQGTAVNSWLNSTSGFNVVRFNSLIQVIEDVPGVQYVVPGTLKLGFSASPTGTTDLTMTGPAPLPSATNSTVAITADN